MLETNKMDRQAILKELSNYQYVPGHGPDYSKMTNEELIMHLKLLKHIFKKAYYEK